MTHREQAAFRKILSVARWTMVFAIISSFASFASLSLIVLQVWRDYGNF